MSRRSIDRDEEIAMAEALWYATTETTDNTYASHALPIGHAISGTREGAAVAMHDWMGAEGVEASSSTVASWSGPVPVGQPVNDGWTTTAGDDGNEDEFESFPSAADRRPSSYLYDLIKSRSWSRSRSHLFAHPADAQFVTTRFAPKGRTPLHEACVAAQRPVPRGVVTGLLQVHPSAALAQDDGGNTPLHLLLTGERSVLTRSAEEEGGEDVSHDRVGILEDMLSVDYDLALPVTANERGMTPLHMACRASHFDAGRVIEQQKDEDLPSIIRVLVTFNPLCAAMVDEKGRTALGLYCNRAPPRDDDESAILLSTLDIATLLLEANAEAVWTQDETGSLPLHHAASRCHFPLVRLLLESNDGTAGMLDGDGKTPLHRCCGSYYDRRTQESDDTSEVVRLLLQSAPQSVTLQESTHQETPLHCECRARDPSVDVVNALLETDPTCASVSDRDGYVPLHCASVLGLDGEGIFHTLLTVAPFTACIKTKKQDTALHLLSGASIPWRRGSSHPPPSTSMLKALLDAYPEAAVERNDYGFTPLHCACRTPNPPVQVIDCLLENRPECVLMKTNGGGTALHLVVCNGGSVASESTVEVVWNLIRSYREIVSLKTEATVEEEEFVTSAREWMTNKVGNTPLHEACFRGSPVTIVEALATSFPEWIRWKNKAGYTPLHLACKTGMMSGSKLVSVLKILCSIGGEGQEGEEKDDGKNEEKKGKEKTTECGIVGLFSVSDRSGHTPLHSACHSGSDPSVVRFLVECHPFSVWDKTAYGDTPLHLCCLRGCGTEVVRVLAEAAAATSHVRGGQPRADGEGELDGCNNDVNDVLVLSRNAEGYTSLQIAMDNYKTLCPRGHNRGCCVDRRLSNDETRIYETLEILIQSLHSEVTTTTRIVHAALTVHTLRHHDVDVDPAFVRRAICMNPEQVAEMDAGGNFPLHMEASYVMKKKNGEHKKRPLETSSWSGEWYQRCCRDECHKRTGVLNDLMELYPEAAMECNDGGEFPLGMMIRNGRCWDDGIKAALVAFPPALLWYEGMVDELFPYVAAKLLCAGRDEVDLGTVFQLVRGRPDFVRER